jgi:predicted phage terminase large subunit-like protein
MNLDRQVVDTVYRNNFGAFAYVAYMAVHPGGRLIPNWHIDVICYQLQEMVMGRSQRRFVVNLPPRSCKSFLISVCLPAWILGRNPTAKILCASYSEVLANTFSRQCRALYESPFYKRVFPHTRLNPRKATEGEFETTHGGYRLATSVGGTLTGRGGDVLIIDDPNKAGDSQAALEGANEWFRTTALSRLDDQQNSLVIVTMQRLHVDDLSGILIEQGWPNLAIPAIAPEPAEYVISESEVYRRPAGQLLQPARDSMEAIEDLKGQMGSRVFAAQYQQNPTPPDGNMIKAAWLGRYEGCPDPAQFRHVVLSCDPAGKPGINNDYTAIVIVGIDHKRNAHVLHAARGHWTVVQMQNQILALAAQWQAGLVLVEDTSTGMGLIQLLREQPSINVKGRRPAADKETRLARELGRFEAGRVLLPREAPWLADLETELFAFPHGRNDDQVDALLHALEWLTQNQYREELNPSMPGLPVFSDQGGCSNYGSDPRDDQVAANLAGLPVFARL